MAETTPVTVLTGFLGAGKTTLLNRLLKRPELAGTAVLVNEFGEIGLDHLLMEALDEDTVLLNAGCLCCTVRGDIARTLTGLQPRIAAGEIRRIVIETTGLADPAPILQTLMTDATVAGRLVLGGVVTTVDAVTGVATLAREGVSQKQVAVADRIVLTKTDLAGDPTEPAEGALLRRLEDFNAGAPVLIADHGRIDPLRVFDAGLYDPTTKSTDVTAWLAEEAHEQSHEHAHARHDADIKTYAILRQEPIRAVALTLFLEALAEHCGDDILRLKGIVNILESPDRPAVIHGVQHVFHPPAFLDRWPSDDRGSRIVVITRRVPQRWVEVLLAAIDEEVADLAAGGLEA
jgi:G3E family GTPase